LANGGFSFKPFGPKGDKNMKKPREFSFGDRSVANAYDKVLVPLLFVPWAEKLVQSFHPWEGKRILDLATGTGVLAEKLSTAIGDKGKVTGVDINSEMLAMAAERCGAASLPVEFMVATAESLELADGSMDVVVCQQGFQFFPDKPAAAMEMHRVLCAGGRLVVTTWCPVEECEFFGAICAALTAIGEDDLSDMMRVPFDFMDGDALRQHFEEAGFADVSLGKETHPFSLADHGIEPLEVAYATPVGIKLQALEEERQAKFRATFMELVEELCTDGNSLGIMTSHVLTAVKR
jgi:ubiquinone/menaquinone biosynthesis C-methylase UbiE